MLAPCFRWCIALSLAAVVASCDKDPPSGPPSEPPPPRKFVPPADSELAAMLGLDAGEVPPTPLDPPPPAGDLKAEADAFVDLETCVRQRARVDSVLGDAIDALGYDTLMRDSCRLIEAVKTKSVTACEPIVASSLRDRCNMSVAVVSGDSLLCPMSGQNHDALCVALARKDPRLCASVPLDRRTTCRAMLGRDSKKCTGDKRCERMVDRWKTLIPTVEAKQELGTKIRLEVTERIDGGKQKPITADLSQFVVPATVFKSPSGAKIMIGEMTAAAWPPFRIAPDPRLAMTLVAAPENIKQGIHPLGSEALAFELLVPKVAQLSSSKQIAPATVNVDMLGIDIGSPVRFNVEVDLGDEANGFHVSLNINTYVRDVVTTNRP